MTIQIQQTFPHCSRCGLMRHHSQPRIEAVGEDGKPVLFCTELCRDEYADLHGLSEPGEWVAAGTVRTRR